MLILGKSEKKFSTTSNLAIIVFCKTFYFILIGSFFCSDMFLWAFFFEKALQFIGGELYEIIFL